MPSKTIGNPIGSRSKTGPCLEGNTGSGHHGMKQLAPWRCLQRIENGVARIAKSAGEFERPDARFVDDGVEVDVAAIAAALQERRHARERELMKSRSVLVSDDRTHLAGQFTQIAEKKPLMLPVEA